MTTTNSVLIIQVPDFNDIDVNDIHTALEGLTSEVETRLKVTPVT